MIDLLLQWNEIKHKTTTKHKTQKTHKIAWFDLTPQTQFLSTKNYKDDQKIFEDLNIPTIHNHNPTSQQKPPPTTRQPLLRIPRHFKTQPRPHQLERHVQNKSKTFFSFRSWFRIRTLPRFTRHHQPKHQLHRCWNHWTPCHQRQCQTHRPSQLLDGMGQSTTSRNNNGAPLFHA